jgi:hypothetical protein
MDIISMILSRNQSGEPLASTEPGAVYTFDGNAEGKEFNENGSQVKIADVSPDLNKLVKVVGLMGGQQLEIPKADFEVRTFSDGVQAAIYQETAMVSVNDGALWVFCNPDAEGYFVSRIEFAETIRPIDPKYIPGAVLPVVELTTELSAANVDGTVLTADETAKVAEVLSENDYAIVKFIAFGLPLLAVCMKTEIEGTPSLLGYFYPYAISLAILEGAGMAFLELMS